MSTITAILEADVDGSLHLPVPAELRRGKLKVSATIEPLDSRRTPTETALSALRRLRASGVFGEIADSVAWQRAQRRERTIQSREE